MWKVTIQSLQGSHKSFDAKAPLGLSAQREKKQGYFLSQTLQKRQTEARLNRCNQENPTYRKRRRQWHPTPVLLPGKSHGWRNLVGCSPWGHQESDTTERLHCHFSLSCIGEGNDNPLQYSCLENPRDGGAWWAAIYGVAQSRTRLKRLSSSNSRYREFDFEGEEMNVNSLNSNKNSENQQQRLDTQKNTINNSHTLMYSISALHNYQTKHFTGMNLLNAYNNPMRQALSFSTPSSRYENYSAERSNNLHQITQIASSRGEFLIQAACLQSPKLCSIACES